MGLSGLRETHVMSLDLEELQEGGMPSHHSTANPLSRTRRASKRGRRVRTSSSSDSCHRLISRGPIYRNASCGLRMLGCLRSVLVT